jgi:hypothetical protein
MKKLIALMAACPALAFAQTPNTVPTTGNVGLGTTAPACKLEVVGNARVTGKTEFDSTLLVRDSVRFESDTKIDGNVFVGGDATFNNRISVAGAIENPYIAHPSELRMVGLGPDGQYRAMDPAFVTSAAYNAACFNQVDKFGNPVGVVPGWASNNGAPSGQTIGVMYTGVPCLAHIGINTDAPQSPLEVNGPASITEESLVRFLAGGNELARITNKGNIGLGMDAPQAKLHIRLTSGETALLIDGSGSSLMKLSDDGVLYVRELKVTLQPFPDYVFESGYELMSLAELEAYIAQHGHLPGMPAAAEVEKGDVTVNTLLLAQQRKIEELTLYILQLEERLKAVENN